VRPYSALVDPIARKGIPMNRTYRIWYFLALLLVLAPPAVRLLWWQRAKTVNVDPAMAQAGEVLFNHEWRPQDPLSPDGDGLGPVFNATSCVACHNQGGVGGAGGLEHNVTTFTVRIPGQTPRQGVVHADGVGGVRESLRDVSAELPAISRPTLDQIVNLQGRNNHCSAPLQTQRGVNLSQRNTPALFGVKLIDEIPERDILAEAKSQRLRWGLAPSVDEEVPVGRAMHVANGRVGRFGWKAQMASLSDFVQAACANELGLGNPGQPQPTPIYYKDNQAAPKSYGLDLTAEQCDQITAFCASLPRPVERLPKDVSEEQAAAGRKLFSNIGCADCHTPKLGPADGIYSDLLLHQMGKELVGGGSYGEPPIPDPDVPDDGPSPSEWRTPPLWGVADSAPYLHDGRAATLEEAILLHSGQGQRAARRFASLNRNEQAELIGFLKTLRAP
jgi:CxxC motif-containing protein (DUF1111 family)